MDNIIIRDGRILDQNGERHGDVLLNDGVIVEVGERVEATGARILDAAGCYVTPGLVDIQVHFRDYGKSGAETIETGSRAAALGGLTAAVLMPNTSPATDNPLIINAVNAKAETALCEIIPSAAITKDRQGAELSPHRSLYNSGVRVFTDDGDFVGDSKVMRAAIRSLAQFPGAVIAQHCEEETLVAGGHMHEGGISAQLGIPGRPAVAEAIAIARDLELIRTSPMRYHVLHLSTARGLELVRQAKAEGLPVTCEVTPQHLVLTHEMCAGFDTSFKMNPPLRTRHDVDALREGLRDGTIDAIATDHAPHEIELKEEPFEQAPPGMLGVETMLSVVLSEVVGEGVLSTAEAIALMSWRAAGVYELGNQGRPIAPGEPANVTVIDPAHTWEVVPEDLASKARNTPWAGRKLTGKARHTIFNGEPVVIDMEATR